MTRLLKELEADGAADIDTDPDAGGAE